MIDFFDQPEPGSSRPFSRATRAGNLVFVSGHAAPHDPARGIDRGETVADDSGHSRGNEQRSRAGGSGDNVDHRSVRLCGLQYRVHQAFSWWVACASHGPVWRSHRGEGGVLLHCCDQDLISENEFLVVVNLFGFPVIPKDNRCSSMRWSELSRVGIRYQGADRNELKFFSVNSRNFRNCRYFKPPSIVLVTRRSKIKYSTMIGRLVSIAAAPSLPQLNGSLRSSSLRAT